MMNKSFMPSEAGAKCSGRGVAVRAAAHPAAHLASAAAAITAQASSAFEVAEPECSAKPSAGSFPIEIEAILRRASQLLGVLGRGQRITRRRSTPARTSTIQENSFGNPRRHTPPRTARLVSLPESFFIGYREADQKNHGI